MKSLVFRHQAITDLNDIWNYTYSNWSETQADKYYLQIQTCCADLSQNPFLGRSYKEIYVGLRGIPVGKHIVFYLILGTEIHVIRILHQSMDVQGNWEQ